MGSTVLVAGARTPIGKFLGSLASQTAPQLGGIAVRSALERAAVSADTVEAAIFGNVVQAGVGANPARQAALNGGLSMAVPASTINKLCLSGMAAIAQADFMIRLGYHRAVVAGGFESMSNAPYLSRGARAGLKYGAAALEDALERDALICAIEGEVMGFATERHQQRFGFTRAALDDFSVASHAKAAAAIESGFFAEEIAEVEISGRSGSTLVATDEGVRAGTTAESLARLRPAFTPDGIITAGSSSQLSDGACALVLMDKEEAERQGLEWLAEIVSYGTVAGPDASLLLQPAGAVNDALARADGLTVSDLDVLEINEAFAGVALASVRDLGVSMNKVNPNGGAIALGHPVGMSGARLILTLAHELKRRGGGIGAAALCGGGGQGDAMIIRV